MAIRLSQRHRSHRWSLPKTRIAGGRADVGETAQLPFSAETVGQGGGAEPYLAPVSSIEHPFLKPIRGAHPRRASARVYWSFEKSSLRIAAR
jgi:hypothetical protein